MERGQMNQSSFMDGTMGECLERGSGFKACTGGWKYGRKLTTES